MVDDISHEGLRVLLRQEGVSFQRLKTVRREALVCRVEVKDLAPRSSQRPGEAGGSLTQEVLGRVGSSPDKVGPRRYCQTVRAR